MENQHRQIAGYRELSQGEIDLMNEIKALGPQLEAICQKIEAHINAQYQVIYDAADEPGWAADEPGWAGDELKRLDTVQPSTWADRGKQSLQEGLMFLTRSVAQPTFF